MSRDGESHTTSDSGLTKGSVFQTSFSGTEPKHRPNVPKKSPPPPPPQSSNFLSRSYDYIWNDYRKEK